MKEPNWFERIFDFKFPAEYYPYVLERVRGTPARLEELVANIDPNILTVKPDDEWSIQEHVGHLWDLEELHTSRLDDFDAAATILTAADLTNKKTYDANHNAWSLNELLEAFRAVRTNFVSRVEDLDEEAVQKSALHPRLNVPMRLVDLLYFTAEHDDHHLASITIIKRELTKRDL
ncbi:MAG: DinB family protein [Chloroflexia bacterium]